MAFVAAVAPRVTCRRHGVVVCTVPWARHRSKFTRDFEDQAAWLAVNTSKSAVAELMRIAWRAVGGIVERVAAEAQRQSDLLDGLTRIGIDEISRAPRGAITSGGMRGPPPVPDQALPLPGRTDRAAVDTA